MDGYKAGCVVVDGGKVSPAQSHLLATISRKQPAANVVLMPTPEKTATVKDQIAAVLRLVKKDAAVK